MGKDDVQKFRFDGHVMAYRKFGSGPKALVAFHGFGQTSAVFLPLESVLANQFTVFAIDLFFHGESTCNQTQPLTRPDWDRLMTAFLQSQDVVRFSLMGFSLGGRFALALVVTFAERIDQLLLIAPDGITQNNWYRLATATAPGRNLFRYALHHLPLLSQLGNIFVKAGLLDRTLMRFTEISLGTPEQREQAYQSWTQFRHIQPDLVDTAGLLNKHPVRVQFITGALDRIVPGRYILPLTNKLRRYELTNLAARHHHLIEQAGPILATAE